MKTYCEEHEINDRDWWNQGINPITGYRIPNQRNVVEEERKYKMDSYGIKNTK